MPTRSLLLYECNNTEQLSKALNVSWSVLSHLSYAGWTNITCPYKDNSLQKDRKYRVQGNT